MALYTIEEQTLTGIANAIREKNGSADKIKTDEMADVINQMTILPSTALTLTGDCQHMFRNNQWNWFIEMMGDKISTKDLTNIDSMFYSSNELKNIPFALNILLSGSASKRTLISDTFASTTKLKQYPQINIVGYGTATRPIMLAGGADEEPNIFLGDTIQLVGFDYKTFYGYPREKEPTWLFDQCDWETARADSSTFGSALPVNWSQAYYIKTIPSMPKFYTDNTGSYYHHWYQFAITHCQSLQEITLPRPGKAVLTSTPSGFTFSNVQTLKHVKFDVQEDGSPYTAQWKNITLSLTSVGWGAGTYAPSDKRVNDENTYAQLKDDPAYWAYSSDYSGYNHDSAVETINSLPDTSAYGTNTIKFRKTSGSKTDGGAINTLTEEEIAVATAKGWTVSLTT